MSLTREEWDTRFRARVAEVLINQQASTDPWTPAEAHSFAMNLADHVAADKDQRLFKDLPDDPEGAADSELEQWVEY